MQEMIIQRNIRIVEHSVLYKNVFITCSSNPASEEERAGTDNVGGSSCHSLTGQVGVLANDEH